MLDFAATRYTTVQLLPSASAANTAAATSSWTQVDKYDGALIFIQNVGAVTGSITGKIQHADDNSGTNAADVTGAAFSAISTANHSNVLVVDSAKLKPYIAYVGTIATGPAIVGVTMLACDQYA